MNRMLKNRKMKYPFWVLAFSAALFVMPSQAKAQCETPFAAYPELMRLVNTDVTYLNQFIQQEINFIDRDVDVSWQEIQLRLNEFDSNIREGLTAWWEGTDGFNMGMKQALKDMTKQLSAAEIDQSRAWGSLMDGMIQVETQAAKDQREVEAQRRYRVPDQSCTVASVAQGTAKADMMARGGARAFAQGGANRRGNATGTPGAHGLGAQMQDMWTEYLTYFCDADFNAGNGGCATDAPMAGLHLDVPTMLWGGEPTLDVSTADQRLLIEASMRYLIDPFSEPPIPQTVVTTSVGKNEVLSRRTLEARRRALYHALGRLYAERLPGSGVTNLTNLRQEAGVPVAMTSSDPSYREVMEAMTRDRYRDPEYIIDLIEDPETLLREQTNVKSTHLQQWNDIYRRWEELIFVFATDYSFDLDTQAPRPGAEFDRMR